MNSWSDQPLLYLWQLHTLYIGDAFKISKTTQAAYSLIMGLDGPFTFSQDAYDKPIMTRSVLIPAGTTLSINTLGRKIAICYLDPLGSDFSQFAGVMCRQKNGIYYDAEDEDGYIKIFCRISEERPLPKDAYFWLMEGVFPPSAKNAKLAVDARVLQVLDIVRKEYTLNHSNLQLAQRVGLSEYQLRCLFREATGISIRRYRMWHRLFVTASLMAQGKSMTIAALEAGFTDSSHFNHAFKGMIGMKPSSILIKQQHVRIHSGCDEAM